MIDSIAGTIVGRLAPSPSGYLHLGNAWAFFLAWLSVRTVGGRIVLRLEDLDPQRSKPEFALAILEDLAWLGLDWDEGWTPDASSPYAQSNREKFYADALSSLGDLVYPCYCTRKELRELAAAPQIEGRAGPYSHLRSWVGDEGAPYPGVCRRLSLAERSAREAAGAKPCLRLDSSRLELIEFTDAIRGRLCVKMSESGGDFALRRSDGVWAYQLAVVLDDAAMGVTQVVRGEDILSSTVRQVYLQRIMNLPTPEYVHLPLLHDAQGDRLAKRQASLSLRALREGGIRPEAVIGWLAALAGLQESPRQLGALELLSNMRRENSCISWLRLPTGPLLLPADIEKTLNQID